MNFLDFTRGKLYNLCVHYLKKIFDLNFHTLTHFYFFKLIALYQLNTIKLKTTINRTNTLKLNLHLQIGFHFKTWPSG